MAKAVSATCIVTGAPLAPSEALWLVRHPEMGWVVDASGKLPAAHPKERLPVKPEAETLAAALHQQDVPFEAIPALLDQAERQLQRDALHWLSLTDKAGLLLSGADTVGKALRNEDLALLIHAAEASEDGIRKMAGIAKSQGLAPSIRLFTQEILAATLGRTTGIIHLGLKPGGVTQSFLRACQRLAGFRAGHGL